MLFKAHPLDGHLRSKTDHPRDVFVNLLKAVGPLATKRACTFVFGNTISGFFIPWPISKAKFAPD